MLSLFLFFEELLVYLLDGFAFLVLGVVHSGLCELRNFFEVFELGVLFTK